MGVVAAGVHDAGDAAAIFDVLLVLNPQGVQIAAEGEPFAWATAVDGVVRDYPAAFGAQADLEARLSNNR